MSVAEHSILDGSAPSRERGRKLAPAMLALIREQGPIDHLTALAELKRQGRVRAGQRGADAYAACTYLLAEGLIERATQGKYRVPSDS